MADDTPQDQTATPPATSDQTPTEEPITQEPPKVEEQPTETPPVETPAPAEEPKPETPPETPKPPKQEEQKPTEETKAEEKPKVEVKPEEPVKEETPKPNLNELRTKANKERQDRKREHLSAIEKLAKSKQINNDDVRELLHVSQTSATRYLEELVKQGKIRKSGKAKATTYFS